MPSIFLLKRSILSLVLVLSTFLVAVHGQEYSFSHIGVEQGLTHGVISSIFKDSKGLVWIGTNAGLNLYNGLKIEQFRPNPNDPNSLNHLEVRDIFEGPNQEVWVSTLLGNNIYVPYENGFTTNLDKWQKTYGLPVDKSVLKILKDGHIFCFVVQNYGLILYDSISKKQTTIDFIKEKSHGINISSVSKSTFDGYWIVYTDGFIEHYDGINGFTRQSDYLYKIFGKEQLTYYSFVDSDGDVWVNLLQKAVGAYCFDSNQCTWTNYNQTQSDLKLNTNIVRVITEQKIGTIWIGTDHGGINVIDKKKKEVSYITNDPLEPKSLVQNSIMTMLKDNDGMLWIGTYKNGVNYYHENLKRFDHVSSKTWDKKSLPFGDINAFVECKDGSLWLGTNGGGLIYFNAKTKAYTSYKNIPGDEKSISSNVIVSLLMDNQDQLWIGTFFGGLNKFANGKITRIVPDPSGNSISGLNVWDILQDSKGNLWFSVLSNGVDMIPSKTNEFVHFPMGHLESNHGLNLNFTYCIAEDPMGNLWVGGGNGIEIISKEDFSVLPNTKAPPELAKVKKSIVVSLLNDEIGRMWIGTQDGLFVYEYLSKKISHLTVEDGLPHNSILAVLRDDKGNIWVSTPNGLARVDQNKLMQTNEGERVISFTTNDGLQSIVYNQNAALKLKNGNLLFGGPNGYNIINPNKLQINNSKPDLIFTDFKILNKSIRNSDKGSIYHFEIGKIQPIISLQHNENVFEIDFAALNYLNPQKNKYIYKLEGFDEDWRTVENFPSVTYTNLDAANYTFKVKAANNDGYWDNEGIQMSIIVLPPIWKTNWAYLFYALLLLTIFVIARKNMLSKAKVKFALEQERERANQMKELNEMKMNFFTNISHELRTPISLILAPIEKLIQTVKDEKLIHQFKIINSNTARLLKMVDQLLDFRKIEMNKVSFHPATGDIVMFCSELVESFRDLAESKGLEMRFSANRNTLLASFDNDKFEKIIYNLLSNAVKFTLQGGKIDVSLDVESNQSNKDEFDLFIRVADTGIGIEMDKLDKIFDRFYSINTKENLVNHGSGIGLSIAQEFAMMHKGTLSVQSIKDVGSTFLLYLPLKSAKRPVEWVESKAVLDINLEKELTIGTNPVSNDKKRMRKIVLVEDHDELRKYLEENLHDKFHVNTAVDGNIAWKIILNELPDLVLTDLKMPKMDGLELCNKIKTDSRTKHIPVIILTADHNEESLVNGLQYGVDGFITKPFSIEALHIRIKNLISQREIVESTFRKKISVESVDEDIVSRDEIMIQEALKAINIAISDQDYSVERLASDLNMSRVNLYKKMMAVVGKSPHTFIRDVRLEHACQLLEKSQMTISEIAYQVGFNDRKTFSKQFKEKYAILPSQYGKD